jgi:putative Mg2+ transporter-C (MgtC) family protein
MDIQTLDIIIKLAVALLLGMIIGLERILTKHDAGVRTYGLVSMGACLFILSGVIMGQAFNLPGESLRLIGQVMGQIVTGIGFLGAGLIFNSEKEHKRIGLTSAAGMWVAAGIGIACGLGLFNVAVVATVLTLITLTLIWYLEYGVVNVIKGEEKNEIRVENMK